MPADLSQFFDTSQRIPKRISQIWLDKGGDLDADCPEKFKTARFQGSIKKMNPDYEYRLWKWRDILQLFEDFPELNRWKHFMLHDVQFFIEKVDIAKLLIMKCWPSLYLDCDSEAKQCFDELIDGRFVCLTFDWIHCVDLSLHAFKDEPSVFNGFMASAPNQPIWDQLLDYIWYNYKPKGTILDSTGPIATGRFMKLHHLYDEHKYSNIYVDRCKIIPRPVMHQKVKNGRLEPTCDPSKAIIDIDFHSGKSWQVEAAKNYLTFAIERNHLILLVLFLFVAMILLIKWLGSVRRESILLEEPNLTKEIEVE